MDVKLEVVLLDGQAEVLADGAPVSFSRAKARDLLVLLAPGAAAWG